MLGTVFFFCQAWRLFLNSALKTVNYFSLNTSVVSFLINLQNILPTMTTRKSNKKKLAAAVVNGAKIQWTRKINNNRTIMIMILIRQEKQGNLNDCGDT